MSLLLCKQQINQHSRAFLWTLHALRNNINEFVGLNNLSAKSFVVIFAIYEYDAKYVPSVCVYFHFRDKFDKSIFKIIELE